MNTSPTTLRGISSLEGYQPITDTQRAGILYSAKALISNIRIAIFGRTPEEKQAVQASHNGIKQDIRNTYGEEAAKAFDEKFSTQYSSGTPLTKDAVMEFVMPIFTKGQDEANALEQQENAKQAAAAQEKHDSLHSNQLYKTAPLETTMANFQEKIVTVLANERNKYAKMHYVIPSISNAVPSENRQLEEQHDKLLSTPKQGKPSSSSVSELTAKEALPLVRQHLEEQLKTKIDTYRNGSTDGAKNPVCVQLSLYSKAIINQTLQELSKQGDAVLIQAAKAIPVPLSKPAESSSIANFSKAPKAAAIAFARSMLCNEFAKHQMALLHQVANPQSSTLNSGRAGAINTANQSFLSKTKQFVGLVQNDADKGERDVEAAIKKESPTTSVTTKKDIEAAILEDLNGWKSEFSDGMGMGGREGATALIGRAVQATMDMIT